MLLPMGRAHDGSNRRSLWSAQHREHPSLFRARPAFASRAGSHARPVPGTVAVPLRSQTNASPFWIILLLVYARSEHGMITVAALGFLGEPIPGRDSGFPGSMARTQSSSGRARAILEGSVLAVLIRHGADAWSRCA